MCSALSFCVLLFFFRLLLCSNILLLFLDFFQEVHVFTSLYKNKQSTKQKYIRQFLGDGSKLNNVLFLMSSLERGVSSWTVDLEKGEKN